MGKATVKTKVEFLACLKSPNLRKPRISDEALGVFGKCGGYWTWVGLRNINPPKARIEEMPGRGRVEALVKSKALKRKGGHSGKDSIPG